MRYSDADLCLTYAKNSGARAKQNGRYTAAFTVTWYTDLEKL